MAIVAGIDGCRGGWLCLVQDLSTNSHRSQILPRIGDLRAISPSLDLVLIDIPIGLSDAGPRTCDIEARRILGRPRGSSVFPAPIRAMLDAESYAEACRIGETTDGRKLSRQTWNIIPKIREVDDFLRNESLWRGRFFETHPELSFAVWNGGSAMGHGKKTPAGRAERESLVRPHFSKEIETTQVTLPHHQFVIDDLLDAFAALWSAQRAARGQAMGIPNHPPRDSCGLVMSITV